MVSTCHCFLEYLLLPELFHLFIQTKLVRSSKVSPGSVFLSKSFSCEVRKALRSSSRLYKRTKTVSAHRRSRSHPNHPATANDHCGTGGKGSRPSTITTISKIWPRMLKYFSLDRNCCRWTTSSQFGCWLYGEKKKAFSLSVSLSSIKLNTIFCVTFYPICAEITLNAPPFVSHQHGKAPAARIPMSVKSSCQVGLDWTIRETWKPQEGILLLIKINYRGCRPPWAWQPACLPIRAGSGSSQGSIKVLVTKCKTSHLSRPI